MTAAAVPPNRLADGGLQLERTSLAWQRTACSIVILAAVGIRLAAHLDSVWITVAASVVGVGTALAVLVVIRQTMPGRRALALGGDSGLGYLPASATSRGLLMSVAVSAMGATALLGVLAMASTGR
ncbi:DUF202 domain-containing protein [Gordonia lacunae]|uniref:DUF202 domain-containing protein n=1 Tax=Gordonia lacunae TaxID=417102 RepID=UPI0039E4A231